jgi:hypothetical protein
MVTAAAEERHKAVMSAEELVLATVQLLVYIEDGQTECETRDAIIGYMNHIVERDNTGVQPASSVSRDTDRLGQARFCFNEHIGFEESNVASGKLIARRAFVGTTPPRRWERTADWDDGVVHPTP